MDEKNTPQVDILDFSGLFKLDVLLHLDIVRYAFYEVGLKKFFAFSSSTELVFIYLDQNLNRFEKNYDWDFYDNPIYCMCFEPSGTWLVIISDQKVLLVPFLPLFAPQSVFDHKWSLSCVTVLPFSEDVYTPISVVWWLTKESDNIIIVGCKGGIILFYSSESQSVVSETKVPGEISQLQMCFDDSLDLLALLICGGSTKQWKLVLEHRSYGYNWLQQVRSQTDKDKRESFMSFIQLSKDKITLLIQGSSKNNNKSQTVEYVLKPTDYLPGFRHDSNSWDLSAQYINGRHFLTAFELNEGTLILESPEECTPSRILSPRIKKDGCYRQGLWSHRLIYLLRKNEIEVHSTSFSFAKREGSDVGGRDRTLLWAGGVRGEGRRAHVLAAREPAAPGPRGWAEPAFLCDLRLPRFALQPCLIVTTCGAYILNTVMDACEWVVGAVCRGGAGAVGVEGAARALDAALPALLRAAAELLLSRGKLEPAHYLYSLSKSPPDGWVARLGVFGKLDEINAFKHCNVNNVPLGNSATNIKILAQIVKIVNDVDQTFDIETKYLIPLSEVEVWEACAAAAAGGLWRVAGRLALLGGRPALLLRALDRSAPCRGALACLLHHDCALLYILQGNYTHLLEFFTNSCQQLDTYILKRLCICLNPLREQFRPIIRDLRQGIVTRYSKQMQQLISAFVALACEVEARAPSAALDARSPGPGPGPGPALTPKSSAGTGLGCGHAHWAAARGGRARVVGAETQPDAALVGRVQALACGRFHTLFLTENGVYASGDNTYGQLGVGRSWGGGVGESARAGGAVLPVARPASRAPAAALAAGHYHSAMLDAEGRLYTWGWGVHGQLGLGTIDDKYAPHLVTKLQNQKVLSVGCGMCHTAALAQAAAGPRVWAWGAGAGGQLGNGARHKSSVPVLVPLLRPTRAIAVGHFMTLALDESGELYSWGASPQQVRSAHAARAGAALVPAPDPPVEPHLAPRSLDLAAVVAFPVQQMSVGWHHACLVDAAGDLYVWGLNYDGQLGSGSRRPVPAPLRVPLPGAAMPAGHATAEPAPVGGGVVLACCGGDYTLVVDADGNIFGAGNVPTDDQSKKETGNRVIMMQTTKRVIKIPSARNNKFQFQLVGRMDAFFQDDPQRLPGPPQGPDLHHGPHPPGELDSRDPIRHTYNPLESLDDFHKPAWPNHIILALNPWIDPARISNSNMAAKVAFHNGRYVECLRLALRALVAPPRAERLYLAHAHIPVDTTAITQSVKKRIKEISLSVLNEAPYPPGDDIRGLPCCCREEEYLRGPAGAAGPSAGGKELGCAASRVLAECARAFPVSRPLWEECCRLAVDFHVEHGLPTPQLEAALRGWACRESVGAARALLCAERRPLSPRFYLDMCTKVLDSWDTTTTTGATTSTSID